MTPEGRVKKSINELLDKYENIYRFMPVPSGYGASSLDYLLCFRGKFVAIEAKAPSKEPTPRQRYTTRMIRAAGGKVFRIDGTTEYPLDPLKAYLDELAATIPELDPGPGFSAP